MKVLPNSYSWDTIFLSVEIPSSTFSDPSKYFKKGIYKKRVLQGGIYYLIQILEDIYYLIQILEEGALIKSSIYILWMIYVLAIF